MATIEIDIEDHLDEVDTSDLIFELQSRLKRAKRFKDKNGRMLSDFIDEVLSDLTYEEILTHISNSNQLSLTQSIKLKEFLDNL